MFEITQLSKTFHLHTQQQAEIPVVAVMSVLPSVRVNVLP